LALSYCSKCGSELAAGAKFCSGCGTPAGTGENEGKATTTTNTGDTAPLTASAIQDSQIAKWFQEIWQMVQRMAQGPISAVNGFAADPAKEPALLLAVVLSVAAGFMSMWAVKLAVLSVARASSGYIAVPPGYITYGSVFMWSGIMFLVAIGGLFGGTYLSGRYLFAGKNRPLAMANVTVLAMVPYVVSMLLAVILAYILPALSVAVLAAGAVLMLLGIYEGAKEALQLTPDRAAYALLLASACTLAILAFFIRTGVSNWASNLL